MGLFGGHPRCRFVQQQQLGLGTQQETDLQPLTLTMGQDRRFPVRESSHPHQIQHLVNATLPLPPGRAGRDDGQFDVCPRSQAQKNRRRLEFANDAEPGTLLDLQGRDVSTAEEDAPLGGTQMPRNHADERGLSRTVRPDHRPDFSFGDGEVDILVRHQTLKAFGQLFDRQKMGHDWVLRLRAARRSRVPATPPRKKAIVSMKTRPKASCQ